MAQNRLVGTYGVDRDISAGVGAPLIAISTKSSDFGQYRFQADSRRALLSTVVIHRDQDLELGAQSRAWYSKRLESCDIRTVTKILSAIALWAEASPSRENH